ncbi:MAG: HAD family hydrolase [Oscillospiraceae bacterium]|nr:HAD family hydrolase [Oscillospiraceae bacterium]MBQ9939039.1 HAD family hydrolase [Oscillospiraceae bacterium]
MFKAVVFDFDYTLEDSSMGIAMSINYALEQMGHGQKPPDAIKKTIGHTLSVAYLMLTGRDDKAEAEQFTKLFKHKADEVMVANTSLYDGVEELVAKLRENGCKTAIVTTKYRFRVEGILEKYGAEDLFDIIVGSDDVKAAKPSPEGLLWVIDRLSLDKADVLYVGDSIVDAKTAANAGVSFAAVLTGTTARADFEGYQSVYIADDVADVCKNVLKIQ